MADLLEQGADRPRRSWEPRGPWGAVLIALVLLVAAGVAVQDFLDSRADRRSGAAGQQQPRQQESRQQPLDPGDFSGPTLRRDAQAARFVPGDHVLLGTAEGPVRVDLTTGAARRLTPRLGEWRPGVDRLVAAARDVVVATVRESDERRARSVVTSFGAAGTARHLGDATRVVPGRAGTGVWLERSADHRPTVQWIPLEGGPPGRPVPLGPRERLLAQLSGELLVMVGPGDTGALLRRRLADGALVGRIATRGVFLDAREDIVLWARCRGCEVLVTDLSATRTVPLPTGSLGRVVAASLAPDGEHVALVVADNQASRRSWDVAIGHLPGTDRAGSTSVPLRDLSAVAGRPQLGWTRSGRLVVSDGRLLYAAGPGWGQANRLPLPVPQHRQLAVG